MAIQGDLHEDLDEQFSWWGGIYEEWESVRELRQRAHSGRSIMLGVRRKVDLQEVCLGTLRCASLNYDILRIVLKRMALNGILANPPLGRLYSEFLGFHQQNSTLDGNAVASIAHSDAWAMKRLLTFMRRKWSRTEMPRDTWLCGAPCSVVSCP